MKYTQLILLVFWAFAIYGQGSLSNKARDSSLELHQEGRALLLRDKVESFDRVLALGKFRKSQQLLEEVEDATDTLSVKNSMYIDDLVDFFSSVGDSDSILQATLFFPDSVFQINRKYSDRLRRVIIEILDIHRRGRWRDFKRIDGLNYHEHQSPNSSSFNLTFENYWPLEVVEFETRIKDLGAKFDKHSAITKEALLFYQLRNELDSINHQIRTFSLTENLLNVRRQKEKIEGELSLAKEKYRNFINIGYALIGLIFLWTIFIRRKSNRMLKNVNQSLLEEKHRSDELLLNILPAEVAKKLKNHATVEAKRHEAVTVLFSDFKNFSSIANQLSPEELIMELDYCFRAFDRIIDKYRLQKIKTIGDAYMCVGGLYTKGDKHIGWIILAALEIQKFLDGLKKERQRAGRHFFEARIGIHIGPVVSGVVGSKKFAFDVWGDTVNVAQQMESNGVPGKVNVSGEIYELVKPQFQFIYRGKVILKNEKEFDMYFVEGKKA